MDRTEKERVVEDFKGRFKDAAVFVADYRGLTVGEVNDLRRLFRKANAEYKVVKNSLVRLAIKGTGLEALKDKIKGTTAVAIARGDVVSVAKAAVDFAKTHENFKLRAAFVEGQMLAAEGIKQLSTMPTHAELRAQLLGLINAPAAKLLAQINAAGQHVAGVLQAKADKDKEAA